MACRVTVVEHLYCQFPGEDPWGLENIHDAEINDVDDQPYQRTMNLPVRQQTLLDLGWLDQHDHLMVHIRNRSKDTEVHLYHRGRPVSSIPVGESIRFYPVGRDLTLFPPGNEGRVTISVLPSVDPNQINRQFVLEEQDASSTQ